MKVRSSEELMVRSEGVEGGDPQVEDLSEGERSRASEGRQIGIMVGVELVGCNLLSVPGTMEGETGGETLHAGVAKEPR